jgi:hypothetical protein
MQNRVKRRCVALLVTVGMLAVPIAMPASASPHVPGSHGASNHGHALVDRNHDHLSDGLDAKLAHASPTHRIDVVATFAPAARCEGLAGLSVAWTPRSP